MFSRVSIQAGNLEKNKQNLQVKSNMFFSSGSQA